jgi:type IV pilus assembly protein PilV
METMTQKTMNTYPLTGGFTLIEILVALLVLSIGMLGIATLQSQGQQHTFTAYARTQSNMLAYEIMDQIRLNRGVARGVINSGTGVGNGYVIDDKSNLACDYETDNLCHCVKNSCTPQQLRDYDLGRWYTRLAETLPGGTGKITATLIPNPPVPGAVNQVRYTISISYDLREEEQENEAIKTITWAMQI